MSDVVSLSSMAAVGTILMSSAGAVAAEGFDGLYAGLSFNSHGGDNAPASDVYNFSGNAAGAFVGYKMSKGNTVLGFEIAMPGDVTQDESPYSLVRPIDLKARAGVTFGRNLAYGVVGASVGQIAYEGEAGKQTNGMIFGLGIETNVTDKMFVGAEYIHRNYQTDGYFGSREDIDQIGTLSIRAGFRF